VESFAKHLKKLDKLVKIVSLIVFALIFYFSGYLIGHKNLVFETNHQPKIVSTELFKPSSVNFSLFWKAWNMVMTDSVDKPDAQKMVYGAISGMVSSMNDPYSVFMDPSTNKTFSQDLSGKIQGIGAEISVVDGKLVVISPLSGSPAEKAGLKPNDQIIKIDDANAGDLTLDNAINNIRGNAGTTVKLTIMRDGWAAPQVIAIQREEVTIKSVDWKMLDNNVGYIKVSQFGDDTTGLMKQATNAIAAKSPSAVILDLRNNPGGYLESAVDMVSMFSDSGTVVVKEKDKSSNVQIEKTTGTPILGKVKLIVLINEGSASAAEIVSGALQDNGRATLVGAKSFGKGSVQEMEDLGGGASLKLTIAEWLTPKDRAINHIGIEPDVKVGLTSDDQKAGRDPQLDKATELAK
jgi:carboxyl-terminal processing protease